MKLRRATESDVSALSRMNKKLIEDEGHRNPMSLSDLEQRMNGWLEAEYVAYLFRVREETVGYCLFKDGNEHVYIRQFFVAREKRHLGHGRRALELLTKEVWPQGKRLRLDVLVTNAVGIDFWRKCGFADYSLMMERE